MARQSGEPKKKRGTLTTKEGVAKLSIFAVSLLIVMKVVASIVTGSIGIRADAVHSVIDLVGVVIGFIAVKVAGKPPDERHTFGHGNVTIHASARSLLQTMEKSMINNQADRTFMITEDEEDGIPMEAIASYLTILIVPIAVYIFIRVKWGGDPSQKD